MANTIRGRLFTFTPERSFTSEKTGKTYKSVTLVLDARRYDPETGEPRYDNYPSFDVVESVYSQCSGLTQGDIIEVSYDIQGRSYKDKTTGEIRYMNTLRAFKIERAGSAPKQEMPQEQWRERAEAQSTQDNDDLPFSR